MEMKWKCAEPPYQLLYNMSIYLEIKDVVGLGDLSFDELFPQLFIEAVREDFEKMEIPEASVIQSSWEVIARQLDKGHTQHHRRGSVSGTAQQRGLDTLS
jgi:hypothetical protein